MACMSMEEETRMIAYLVGSNNAFATADEALIEISRRSSLPLKSQKPCSHLC